MTGKKGLIPVQRLVVRNGKTFTQTVYIKMKHENKVDKQKNVQVPDWKFGNEDDFKNEVDRINNLNDRSERQILKEHLLDHIEKEMKVSWDKVPDTEERAFVRNTLRAFSAAKKHLKSNPVNTAKTLIPTPNQSGVTITKQPGKDYIMDRDKSKQMARDVRDKHGNDKLLEILKANNITWDEVPDEGPNRMRALRALASFIRKGGELGEGKANNGPALVVSQPDKKLNVEPKSKYEKDSIPFDYEKATPKQKLIGLATGVLPVDDETTTYLETLVKEGKFGVLDIYGDGSIDYGLPKALDNELSNFIDRRKRNGERGQRDYTISNVRRAKHLFTNTPYENDYKEFATNFENFATKWGNSFDEREGVNGVTNPLKLYETISSVGNLNTMTGIDFLTGLASKLEKTSTNKADINKLWDTLELDKVLSDDPETSNFSVGYAVAIGRTSIMQVRRLMQNAGDIVYTGQPAALSPSGTALSSYTRLIQDSQNGTLDKGKLMKAIAESLQKEAPVLGSRNTIKVGIHQSYGFNSHLGLLQTNIRNAQRAGSDFNGADFKKEANAILADLQPLSTPEANHISFNILLHKCVENAYVNNRSLKSIKDLPYKAIDKDVFLNSKDLEHTVKIHIGTARQKTDKAKEKYKAKFESNSKDVNYAIELKTGADAENLDFLDAEKAKKLINSTLMKVPDEEAKQIEQKVQDTHDRSNHSFKTVVHGVYRVKRIASEDKFKKINDDINTTGYYYHGTSFDTCQKILGQTGGFKVFKDSKNIKAGSMLGYGIYLASQSSKSVQYVGNGFRSGNRGVLFLCKASLGKVVQTVHRGQRLNQPIMDDPNTDTVFMDKPHVINPEWAVKRAEQAVPRLWIDVERR